MDTSKIEGYAEMTAEQKIAALEAFEIETPADNEVVRLKNLLSKANSEAKSYKDALREKQTEAERAEAERAEADRVMREELNGYKTKERIANYTAQFLGIGYDNETAAKMATDLPEGVTDEFFKAQKAFIEGQKAAYESAAMNKQLDLTAGKPLAKKNIENEQIDAIRKAAGLK